jgi:hypothetical protein
MIPSIGFLDLILFFFYLLIIYLFAFIYQKNKVRENDAYRYFIFGLTTKILGGIGFLLISIFYYKGGDTFIFFNAAEDFRTLFFSNFSSALDIFFTSTTNLSTEQYELLPKAFNSVSWTEDVHVFVKLTALFNCISFDSYLISTLLFSVFSFLGLWVAYLNLSKIYPKASLYLLIPFFLIPSSLLWSSGILKDTITVSSIGWIVYSLINVFVFRKKIIINVLILIVGLLLLLLLKPYVLYVLVPCVLVWVDLNLLRDDFYLNRRKFIISALLCVLISVSFLLYIVIPESKYNFTNIESTLKQFHQYHSYLGTFFNQSGYSFENVDYSFVGFLEIIPEALNVTFFRPYLWEIKNLPTFLGAIESFMLLLFCIYLIISLRSRLFKIIIKNN